MQDAVLLSDSELIWCAGADLHSCRLGVELGDEVVDRPKLSLDRLCQLTSRRHKVLQWQALLSVWTPATRRFIWVLETSANACLVCHTFGGVRFFQNMEWFTWPANSSPDMTTDDVVSETTIVMHRLDATADQHCV